MGKVDGGYLLGKALGAQGVEKAFVLCGGHIMPIFYGMRQAGIEIIDLRHECAAVYAASAYAQVSGKPGVVVTTAGPGVGNTAAGMMEADSLGVPLIQIGGAVAMNQRDAGALQDMDTLNLMETVSRWARKVTNPARIPEYVAAAFRESTGNRPGPVYLEIPTDLLSNQLQEEEVPFPRGALEEAIPFGDPALVDAAAKLLAGAERPVILVDDGARFSLGDHAASVRGLSDFLQMPVGVGGRQCRGMFGDEGENPQLRTMAAAARADVVLTLGCRFDFRLGFGRMIPPDAKVIQVHTDTGQIGFNLGADIGIVGGAGPVAAQLLEVLERIREPRTDGAWLEQAAQIGRFAGSSQTEAASADGSPVHPGRCAAEVARFIEEDAKDWTVVCDGGEAGVWMGGAAVAHRPGQILGTGPNGTIGTGPCLAIGAWAANGKPVLWYTGDGSFGFYAMEMDTMDRLGIPVVCVMSNDSAWGMIRLTEKYVRPDEISERGHANVDLHPMRAYERMVSMWDGHGEQVTEPGEIVPAIRRAAANGKPSLVNVQVDQVSLSPFIAGYAKALDDSD